MTLKSGERFDGSADKFTLEVIAESLGPGETHRGLCPKCNGGSGGEKSFSISRDERGTVLWYCFRASCGYRGRMGDGPVLDIPGTQSRPKSRIRPFTRPLDPLTEEQKAWFYHQFDIMDPVGVYYCADLEAFAHKVVGPLGQHRGWMVRRYGGSQGRLDIAYPGRDENYLNWHLLHEGRVPTVVVEDCLSAIKVAEAGFRCVALLGIGINYDKAYEIAEWGSTVHLALDRGPREFGLMLRYREMFGHIWEDTKIWSLDKDLKYVSKERIKKAVMDGKYDFVGESI